MNMRIFSGGLLVALLSLGAAHATQNPNPTDSTQKQTVERPVAEALRTVQTRLDDLLRTLKQKTEKQAENRNASKTSEG